MAKALTHGGPSFDGLERDLGTHQLVAQVKAAKAQAVHAYADLLHAQGAQAKASKAKAAHVQTAHVCMVQAQAAHVLVASELVAQAPVAIWGAAGGSDGDALASAGSHQEDCGRKCKLNLL